MHVIRESQKSFGSGDVPRPPNWGGYHVMPDSLEFLEFDESRIHRRVKYLRDGESWRSLELQP
ncbi:MAG TPA: pyridoxine 5'-phosphate oxidase C-terminal domain-containing protein [Gemmatimonadaceae bacterium]|nr:pyridoxine 5'-phosphate oxidase C-terminal domain-containing protein [Gemmatimonadaceae bacterium]